MLVPRPAYSLLCKMSKEPHRTPTDKIEPKNTGHLQSVYTLSHTQVKNMPLRDGFVSPERLLFPLAPGPKSEVKWCQSSVTGASGVSCGPHSHWDSPSCLVYLSAECNSVKTQQRNVLNFSRISQSRTSFCIWKIRLPSLTALKKEKKKKSSLRRGRAQVTSNQR